MNIFHAVLWPVWLFLVFWVMFSGVLGITTKKERLCAWVVLDAIGVFAAVELFFESSHWYSRFIWAFMFLVNVNAVRRDYQRWKNTDDDDEWKKRRKSWAKSHLPKPVVKTIPQPI